MKKDYLTMTEYNRKCKGCGKDFTTTNHRINYCQKPHPYTCEYCGKTFETEGPFKKTCSDECRFALMGKKLKNTWSDPKLREKHSKIMSNDAMQTKRKEKYLKTMKDRYGEGITNGGQLKSTQEKMRKTNQDRYGADTPLGSKQIQDKIKRTNLERYGVENPGGIESTLKKIKKTNLERFGVEWSSQSAKIREINSKRLALNEIQHYEEWEKFDEFILKNPNKYNCKELSEYFNIRYQTIRSKALKLNVTEKINDYNTYSQPELQMKKLLDEMSLKEGVDYIPHNRKLIPPYEVDFYFPKQKLAIEISPSYYHSSDTKEKDYHFNKFLALSMQNVELITVFDWHDQTKMKEMISFKLKGVSTRVGANKTTVKLSKKMDKETHKFIEDYHLLGDIRFVNLNLVVKLIHNEELVGVGVFTNTKNENIAELKRLVFKSNLNIPGGASKIIKHFERNNPNVTELMTYSDNDLGQGKVYERLGFKLTETHTSSLNWYNEKEQWHIKNLSLIKQGADRLLKEFPNYIATGQGDHLPSNQEIVRNYNFIPVYDCGWRKWRKKINE